jgi:hypothetical protein
MTEQCYGRLQKDGESHRARFQDNHRFFLEYRCGATVFQEQLCKKCLEWKQRGLKKNDHYRSLHGLITEAIPEWSHIFEGPWYQSKVVGYGHPSESEMARAKKAQEDARKYVVMQEAKCEQKAEAEQKPEPKRRSRKKTAEPTPLPPPPEPEPKPEPNPTPPPPPNPGPKPAAKRLYKKKEKPVATPKQSGPVQAVESSTLPTEVEIVKIVVRPFFANDTHYFRDPVKNKLYAVGNDKRPTKYIGRWDPESETIDTEFPDSDVE